MGVSATHPQFDEYIEVWKTCGAVSDGQRAVHAMRERFLPKLTGEDETQYKARLARSDFFAATWRTVAGFVGMAFRKDPASELPTALEAFALNIDNAGTSLDGLAGELVEEVLEYGRIGLMVDHPPMPENVQAISRAAWEGMNLRPTLKTYGAKAIINWRYQTIANVTKLVMVVLAEKEYVAKDEFSGTMEDRYRVLDLDESGHYRQRVFKVDERGQDVELSRVYPMMNNRPMTEIPFYIIGTKGIALECEEPPLIDLVYANIAHYQVNSDYRHGLHFTGLPTLFLAGVVQDDGQQFYIGGQAAITSPDPNAKGMFIEYSGQGLGAIKEALAGLEQRMAILGARMIADETRQAETLGATQIKRAGENSVLSAIVLAVSSVIEKALGVMAQWAGASGPVVYQINREFAAVAMDAQQLTALVGAWQNGALSDAELYDLFQRGDVIDGAKPYEEHQEEVAGNPAIPRPVIAA
jgi:hypothetical protein